MVLSLRFVFRLLSAGSSAVAARIRMVIDAVLGAIWLLRLSSPTMSQRALFVELSRQVLLGELRTRLHDLLRAACFDRL